MLKDIIEKFSDQIIMQTVKMNIYKLPRMTTVYDISLRFHKKGYEGYYKSLSTHNYDASKKGNEKSVLRNQKQNLEKLVGNSLFNIQEIIELYDKCIVKNIPLKIVLLGDELIAIASLDETKFLLTEDISKPIISKEDFIHYVEELLSLRSNKIISDFFSDVEALYKFLEDNSQHITNLNIDDIDDLEALILKLHRLNNQN